MLDGSIKKKLEKYTISPLSIWTPLSVDNYIYYCATNRVWSKRSFVRFSTNNASTLFLKYTYKLSYAINVIKWIDRHLQWKQFDTAWLMRGCVDKSFERMSLGMHTCKQTYPCAKGVKIMEIGTWPDVHLIKCLV